jgi:hypothetical protein
MTLQVVEYGVQIGGGLVVVGCAARYSQLLYPMILYTGKEELLCRKEIGEIFFTL